MAAARLALLACLLAGAAAAGEAAAEGRGEGEGGARRGGAQVTPVEKVVELLEKLQVTLVAEGKEEAAAYDKYACFCKEQSDNKLYAIEKSEAQIAKLSAQIDLLASEIAGLEKDVADLTKKIDGLDTAMTDAKKTRDTEHAAFLVSQADAKGAIDACERAIAALKESKAAQDGKTELEGAALAQVRSFTTSALALASLAKLSEQEYTRLQSLAQALQPGQAYEYKYHSNDIIATLEDLRLKFKQTLNDVEQSEFDTNAAFETKQLAMANEKKFAEQEKTEKAALAESKTEEKATAQQEKDEETNDKNSDNNYLQVLVADCEAKGTLWDQRSKTRADELKAIADATEALKSGVAPNWQANKKLAEVQTATAPHGQPVRAADRSAPHGGAAAPSFLQLRRLRGAGRGGAAERKALLLVERARAVLNAAAEDLKSPILSAAALRVRVTEDHFVKVRQLIKDLVARLQADADSEQTQKTFCDGQMKEAITKRDTEQSKIEDFTAQITGKEAKKAQLQEDIALLSEQIAQNKKALKEATELREAEKAENERTIADATTGKAAVDQALQILKTFYEGAALLQRSAYVPPNSDREGKTLADLAPPIFDTEYKAAQESSKGILGILQVISSDFERTISATKDAEDSAALDFATFKQTIEDDTAAKEKTVQDKQGEITTIEDDMVTLHDKLHTATTDKSSAEASLKELESMCVAGEETYEERVAKRNQEIAALKEAHAILESWQG